MLLTQLFLRWGSYKVYSDAEDVLQPLRLSPSNMSYNPPPVPPPGFTGYQAPMNSGNYNPPPVPPPGFTGYQGQLNSSNYNPPPVPPPGYPTYQASGSNQPAYQQGYGATDPLLGSSRPPGGGFGDQPEEGDVPDDFKVRK